LVGTRGNGTQLNKGWVLTCGAVVGLEERKGKQKNKHDGKCDIQGEGENRWLYLITEVVKSPSLFARGICILPPCCGSSETKNAEKIGSIRHFGKYALHALRTADKIKISLRRAEAP
jgi:hypothetical protein